MNIEFLAEQFNHRGILGSKASGEPSLTVSCAVFYAIKVKILGRFLLKKEALSLLLCRR